MSLCREPVSAKPLRPAVLVLCALGAALAATSAAGGAIELKNAWTRPMAKGYPVAAVYIDIHSDIALKLVGAASPVAKSVAIIIAGPQADGTQASPQEVGEIDVRAGKDTRLPLNGDYLELRQIVEDKGPGTTVPLRLEFVDSVGTQFSAETEALVRGVALRPPPPAARPLARKPAAAQQKNAPPAATDAPAAAK